MPAPIVVTGATGFIGRRACLTLAERGISVRAVVREAAGAAGLPPGSVALGEFGPDTPWSDALADADAVIHLAARVHVMRETASDPDAAFHPVNVAATESLVRAAAACRVRRFVYVSSIKVNGEATCARPFSAFDDPRPQDPYGRSKWLAEQAVWRCARETGLEVTVVRPPLVYGPGVGGNFLRLLGWVKRGIPLPLASIHNRRSMIFQGNLVDALIACALVPAAGGKTYLVSDGEDVSTPSLISAIASAMGVPPRLWRCPPALLRLGGFATGKSAEVHRLTDSLEIDSTPIVSELGWAPPVTFCDGLDETIRWFLEARGI